MSIVSTSPLEDATIRSLLGFDAEGALVTTCYLDVDGRRHPSHLDLERAVERTLRQARTALGEAAAHPDVVADLQRVVELVRAGFDRSETRGLAVFACAARGLFEVVELPVRVRDRVVVNSAPALSQLEAIVQEHKPIGVLLADRQRTRMFVFDLGRLAERTEVLEELPRGYDERGAKERGSTAPHVDALASTHLRHAADLAFRVNAVHPFEHLLVGGADEVLGELEAALHPYLVEKLRGRVALPVTAGLPAIRTVAEEEDVRLERARESARVDRLRDAANSGGRGVVGLADTLRALSERRVDVLLVSDGYAEEGWRCPSTGALAATGPHSPMTGEPMQRVGDVVVDAVDLAYSTGCTVDVCVDSADLDCLGRIGALLRY